MKKLYIFDLDGTLVGGHDHPVAGENELLPGVFKWFKNRPENVQVAIATNQGGIGMRHWMQFGGFGNPHKYPTLGDINYRMSSILRRLGGGIRIYMSFRYQSKKGHWCPIPEGYEDDPQWSVKWRKPNPGMLLQAIEDAQVDKEQAVFVGNWESDELAAEAAGIDFVWAKDFFK